MAGWQPERYDPPAQQQRIGHGQPPPYPDPQQDHGQPHWESCGQPPWQSSEQPPPQQPRPPARRQVQYHPRSGAGGSRRKVAAIVGGGFVLLLIIIGIALSGNGTPTGNTSPAAPIASPQTTSAIKAAIATQPTTAAATSQAATPSTPAAPSSASQTTPAAAPASSAAAGCHPLSSSGNCYSTGERCPAADHGLSGVAANGEAVTCENNDGWHWEPS
jgi:hypothetical protein